MRYISFFLPLLLLFIAYQPTLAQEELAQLPLEQLYQFTEKNPDEGYEELIKRRDRAIVQGDQQNRFEVAKYLARYGYLIGNNPLANQYIQEVDSLTQQLENVTLDISYQNFLIAYAIADIDSQKAIDHLKVIKEEIFSSRDTNWIITYHCQSARAFASMDDHAVALKHLYEAQQLNNHFNDEALQAFIHTSYASIYWEQQKHQLAFEKDLQAMEYYERAKSYRNLLPLYTNLMTKAMSLGKKDKALEFSEKYDLTKKKFGANLGYFITELNRIFFLIQLEEYEKAKEQAFKTIDLAKKMDRDSSHAFYLLGVTYRGLKRFDLAAKFIKKAFDIGKSLKHNGKCSFYSHALYQTYYWDYQYAPALDWYRTHISFRDSVYNEKKAKEIAIYESKLEALEQRRKVEELEAKAEINRQQNRVLWVSIILGSLLAFTLIYAQRQRAFKEIVRNEGLLVKSQLEKEQLQQQLEFKQREVTTQILHMTHKNALLKEIQEDISQLKNGQNGHSVSKLIHLIDNHLDNATDWDYFLDVFKSIHSSFLNKLQSLADNLTSSEIRLASLMKMNMSSKEIATMLNISNEGVKKARYRLRKKLALPGEKNLQEYLLQL